jgi:hypothetical protein
MATVMISLDKSTGYAEYICETISDLDKFSYKENLFGCIAYVLENKKLYIMNSQGEWEAQD